LWRDHPDVAAKWLLILSLFGMGVTSQMASKEISYEAMKDPNRRNIGGGVHESLEETDGTGGSLGVL
jgi:hypothetical protein